jgi:hypothetical protein
MRVTQVQLDKLFALLSAVKAGEASATEAIQHLLGSPHWVWGTRSRPKLLRHIGAFTGVMAWKERPRAWRKGVYARPRSGWLTAF